MQKYHITSPIRSECIRIFSLIHEISEEQSTNINSNNLSTFIKSLNLPCQVDLVKFIHKLDKQNKEMRFQYWGYCISRMLENVYLSCEREYNQFHDIFKQFLIGVNVKPLEEYQLWDGNQDKKMQERDALYARIINAYGEMSMYIGKIDIMLFTSNIANINTCFSLITLYPGKTQQILTLYQKIITGTFLQTLQFSLSTVVSENILTEMLKSLCYLYQCQKYQKLQKLLKQSFLSTPSTLQGLLQNITDKRPQIRYYTCVLMSLMINNQHKLSELLFKNKKLLYQVSNVVGTVAEKQGLRFGVEFFIGVVKSFAKLELSQKADNMEIITVYLKFAVGKLSQLESEKTLAACIRLVLEIVKTTDLDQQSVKLLKFIDNVFEGQKIQKFQSLFFLVLQICKFSIIMDRKNIKQYITKDKSFETYVRNLLKQKHEQWQPFHSCLHLMLLMSSDPQLCDILFQRDLIECVLELSQSKNGLVLYYVSQILLFIIINSMESEWKVTYLYEKNCLKCIGQLIMNCNVRDPVLQQKFVTNVNISYFNRYAFVNCLKALHFLNFETGNLFLLKKQQYTKHFSEYFIQKFSQGLYSFLQSVPNPRYLQNLLKQQHSLSRLPNSQNQPVQKLYKLISNTIQQMTYNLRKRNNDIKILKLVNNARNIIYTNFYGILTYNELIVESIPIYILFAANVNGIYVKQKVYRLAWTQFRSLMWEFVKRAVGIEAQFFQIFEKFTRQEIRHQDDYRRTLESILNDYTKYNFVFEVDITTIREKQQSVNVPIGMGSMRIGSPEQEPYRNIPRFMSYQMPQARDFSPFNNRRKEGSSSRREGSPSRRGVSPTFGVPCLNCRRTTPNSSQYCNQCIQNRQYR